MTTAMSLAGAALLQPLQLYQGERLPDLLGRLCFGNALIAEPERDVVEHR